MDTQRFCQVHGWHDDWSSSGQCDHCRRERRPHQWTVKGAGTLQRSERAKPCPHGDALLRTNIRGHVYCAICRAAISGKGARARCANRAGTEVEAPPVRVPDPDPYTTTYDAWYAWRAEPSRDAAPTLSPLFGSRAMLEMQKGMGGRQ